MVEITLVDGKKLELADNISVLEVAQEISEGLARQAIAGLVNNELVDLSTTITNDSTVQIITSRDKESHEILNHTTAHVFAQAVLRMFPKAKLTIGPPIENGFWYDVDCDEITEEILPKIEAEMQKIIKENLEITKEHLSIDDAKAFYKNNEYKLEIIEGILNNSLKEEEGQEGNLEDGNTLQFYSQGEFKDLCRGPHLPKTGLIKAFKLEKVTRAYWRGNSDNKQLVRVYGAAFWKKSEMDEYYEMLEEAKKRDHRIVGKKLKLFMNHEYAPGMAFFLPKGFEIYKELQYFVREQYRKHDFREVMTPNMFNKKLWETSGHWEHYKEDMFIMKIEDQDFSLKPMNCPSHCLIFKNEFKSYRELPIRIADFGALHRNELSGALSGLTRVRKFCQDDAHIFCTKEQIVDEIDKALQLVDYIYNTFDMTYEIELSTRPEGKIGSDEVWDIAEKALADAIERNNKEYEICEGDGAFYGPKIDFRIKDCLGRVHQTATIQLDFNLPERFDLTFENQEGHSERPVMIHRAVLGSVERFMAIMIEHFAGKFPLWLSPNQIKIIPVADRHKDYCESIRDELFKLGFKIEIDSSHEGVGKKIAMDHEDHMSNYMLILGDKDVENKTISVRTRKFENGKNEEFTTTLKEFIERIEKERSNREIYY